MAGRGPRGGAGGGAWALPRNPGPHCYYRPPSSSREAHGPEEYGAGHGGGQGGRTDQAVGVAVVRLAGGVSWLAGQSAG